MVEIILVEPKCKESSKADRLKKIIFSGLAGFSYETISTEEEFEFAISQGNLQGKRILFAISLGESGINLEFYGILKKIRMDRNCLKGSVGAILVDGYSELFTKSVARALTLSANMSGCTFPGKPLVEGTKSLKNFSIISKNLGVDAIEAYVESGKRLIEDLVIFNPVSPKSLRSTPDKAPNKTDNTTCEKPANILVLHASSYETSNTLNLWEMVKNHLTDMEIVDISLRNGSVVDCIGCPYTMCLHYGKGNSCHYGGVIVEQVYPAIQECDALVMLCPNYNDAISANLSAFVNRLTALFRKAGFYDKYLFAIIVSGYSGSDIVAEQLIAGLNMNKSFILPGHFAMMETANDPKSIYQVEGIEERAVAFAENMKKYLSSGCGLYCP